MSLGATWLLVALTVAVLMFYEVLLYAMSRRRPQRMARSAHASLREEWYEAVSAQKGSEILAVQTLRNCLMSATMLASTAALRLMGTVTLTAPSLHVSFGEAVPSAMLVTPTPTLALELVLLGLLFTSLVSTVMAVRFYNHAGFIAAISKESPARKRWDAAGKAYVRKAGLLYSVGMRHLIWWCRWSQLSSRPLRGPSPQSPWSRSCLPSTGSRPVPPKKRLRAHSAYMLRE